MVESVVEGLRERDGLAVDAGYGAVVTVFLSVVPFSSLLGGVVAAGRGERGYPDGFGVGLVAGVFAAVPLVALFVPALAVAAALGFGVAPSSPAYGVFIALVGLFFLVYTVGLSALGGGTGIWIREQTDWELDPNRWI